MFAKYTTTRSFKLIAIAIGFGALPALAHADPLMPMVSPVLELEQFLAPNGVALRSAEESAERLFSDSTESTHLVSPELHELRGSVDVQSLARFQGAIPHSTEAGIAVPSTESFD